MGNLFFIAAALFVLWWVSKNYGGIDLFSALRKHGKTVAGALLVLAGLGLLARGQVLPAAVSFICGFSLFGWDVFKFFRIGGAARTSRFISNVVDLEVDNLTGHMDGVVKSGKYAGQRLSRMTEGAIREILNDAVGKRDASSAGLLQAYLHRRFAAGSEHAQGNGNARSGRRVEPGAITEQEAYDILGLKPGASTDEIKGAYRSLMKRLHPDHGGTAYLAARVNEAKDVLLNRHR